MDISALLSQLGVDSSSFASGPLAVCSPIDGSVLGHVTPHTTRDVQAAITQAAQVFRSFRELPAPKRGELIRVFGTELRANKALLAELVSVECGKIRQEALGEVQEMIDICDFAVGLSRQLYGLTIASERAQHRMQEQWHPLGPVCVISAFNFPVAVWAWNFTLAIVCGNPVIWKPSEKTPLCALACQALWERAANRATVAPVPPKGLSQVVIGTREVGEALVNDPRVALVSATGSTAMGRAVGPAVAARFGRALLELGGNNAMVVTPTADLRLAVRAILFSAVGTAGQRCTSLRRLFLHESIHDNVIEQLTRAYADLKIGSPLLPDTLVGPLIDRASYERMQASLEASSKENGKLIVGGKRVLADQYPQAYYVQPALVSMPQQSGIVCEETFAPILWILPYRTLDEAIDLHNAVEQGLSSCIFSNDLREAEQFLSARGSDCGIANVNIGPSGAEIGGAFGGEKATGGGRESGSDAWKNYMRRATNTVNYGSELPLAQGIRFAGD